MTVGGIFDTAFRIMAALDTQVWPYELLLGNDDIKDGCRWMVQELLQMARFTAIRLLPSMKQQSFLTKLKIQKSNRFCVRSFASKHADFAIELDIGEWRDDFLSKRFTIINDRADLREPAYISQVRHADLG